MFLRHGGCSTGVYSSLNLSFGTGDNPERIRINRQRLKANFHITFLASAVQVHGTKVLCSDEMNGDKEFASADALISNQPGVGLLIQQADCQAVLFYDPVQQVIGAAHSGWRGSTENIVAKTVAAMQRKYDVVPANIRAVVSPSLGPCCAEFIHAASELPESFFKYQVQPDHFDFWEISRQQLLQAGIQENNIELTQQCTACSNDFFSYRRSVKNGQSSTGRNGSLICLPTIVP